MDTPEVNHYLITYQDDSQNDVWCTLAEMRYEFDRQPEVKEFRLLNA